MSRFFDRRLFRTAQPQRAWLGCAVAAGTLAGGLTVLQARTLSHAVSGVFLANLDLAAVTPIILTLVILSASRGLASWLGDLAAAHVAQHVKNDLRARLIRHIVNLGPAFLKSAEGERTGELANTALEGVEALDAYFSQYLPQIALAAVIPLTFLIFVFPIDPLSALVLLLTAPLIPIFMSLIGSLTDALTRRQWSTLSRLAAHFLDVLQGLTTLKLLNRSREQIVLIRRMSALHRDATLQVLRVAFLSAFVLEMVGTISTAIVAVEVGLRLLAGRLTFEPAFFVLILAPEFYLPLRLLGTRFHAGVSGVAAAQRIFDLLAASPTASAPISTAPVPTTFGVALRNVSVAYPDRTLPALTDVSFEIDPGEHVALVGPTGAGKSTVAALLLRFVEPASGEITVGGARLSDLSLDDWRGRVAYVPQEPYLLNASVADNIRLGRPDASDAAVMAAARAARADAFIDALPAGYATVLGERGARLSGGQAQRIALARAFLIDASLVILDEATANLDPATDADIRASLRKLLVGRSALIIAHRLATVRSAHKIVMLEAGRLVEQGQHDRLVAAGGPYAALLRVDADRPSGPRPFSGPEASSERDSALSTGSAHTSSIETDAHALASQHRQPMGEARHAPHAQRLEAGGVNRTAAGSREGPLAGLFSFLAPYTAWIVLSVLLGFLTVGSSIGLLSASAWIIATAALQPSVAVLQVAIVGVRFFGIARGVFRYLERLVSHQVTFRALAAIRVWFYAAIEPLAPARLARNNSGDLLARVLSDVSTLENFYVRAVSPPVVAILIALLTAGLLAAFDLRLVAPVLAFQALAGVGLPILTLWLGQRPGRALAETRGALNQSLVDLMQGLPDLLAFRAAERHIRRADSQGASASAAARTMAGITAGAAAGGALLTWLAVAAVLVVATPLVHAGQLSGVAVAVLTLLALASFEAVLPLPAASQYLAASAAAGRRLFTIAGRAPHARDVATVLDYAPSAPAETVAPLARPLAVRLERVSLRYAPGDPFALDDVSLAVLPGSRLALVGPSGAGKSSLVNALLRFWPCEAGALWIGDRNVASMDEEEVRALIAVVSQQTHLFNATIRTNLLLARPSATDAEIEAAARAAQIHNFIVSLPEGYETRVGEGGRKLSGGERQRLSIARALLKTAPVLILDEPTAGLDAATEASLWDALAPILATRTTLLITHRLGGPATAGHIAVMAGGRIHELGTHAALLAMDGLYRRLWDQQQSVIS